MPERKKKESDWAYHDRVEAEFKKHFELERENVCLAGVRMAFRMPLSYDDQTWGFFKDNCRCFIAMSEVQGPPDARTRWEVTNA